MKFWGMSQITIYGSLPQSFLKVKYDEPVPIIFLICISAAHDELAKNKQSIKTEGNNKDEDSQTPRKLPINCPQPSVSIDRLQPIMETEDGNPQCPYCQYSNIATQAVKDHMNVVHERRKWYGCPLCQLNSSCKRTIINHLKKKHELSTNDVFIHAIQLNIPENTDVNKKVCKCGAVVFKVCGPPPYSKFYNTAFVPY